MTFPNIITTWLFQRYYFERNKFFSSVTQDKHASFQIYRMTNKTGFQEFMVVLVSRIC